MSPIGAIEASALGQAMRQSLYLYPAVETVHIVGLALLFGSIAVLDLRQLGLARDVPVTRLARHVAERVARHAEALLEAVRDEGDAVPARVREAALRLSGSLTQPLSPDREP